MKFLLFCFSLYYSFSGYAQQAPADTTKPRDKVNTPISTDELIPRGTPKSPNSVAFDRYGTYPVSLYTGLPTIEIPLFEYSVDNYTVPVKLTYHGSGNKVADQASWVGLGWTLQYGGKISRTILGLPDENDGANTSRLLNRSLASLASLTISGCQVDQSTSDLLLNGIASGRDDAQRDEFMYQLPSSSNTFIMSYPEGAVFLSPEVTKINSTTDLTSFTLLNAGGTTFEFNQRETFFDNLPVQTSGWFLNRITGRNPSQQAVYSYTSVGASNSSDVTYIRTFIDQTFGTGAPLENDGTSYTIKNNNFRFPRSSQRKLIFRVAESSLSLSHVMMKHLGVAFRL